MIVMDSSGWVEIVRGGARDSLFREQLETADLVIVPALVLYEVYRVIERQRSEAEADRVVAHLQSHTVVDLTGDLAIRAARLGREHGLALGDAVVYTTAREFGATLVTGDNHFARLPDVKYVAL